jgi:hypothetical protein
VPNGISLPNSAHKSVPFLYQVLVLTVPEHDRLPLVLDGNEAGHPVFSVSVRSFSGVAEDFTSAGREEDLQVSSIHS